MGWKARERDSAGNSVHPFPVPLHRAWGRFMTHWASPAQPGTDCALPELSYLTYLMPGPTHRRDTTSMGAWSTTVIRVRRGGMTRRQWLLIVVIAAGLVGMHHLLLVCTAHTTPMTIVTGPGSSPTVMPPMSATPSQHADPDPARMNPAEATSVVTSQPDCVDPMDMVGHFCLAVLTTITTIAAALIVAVARCRPLEPGYLPVDLSAVAARAPPVGCARFTQLCVLRR